MMNGGKEEEKEEAAAAKKAEIRKLTNSLKPVLKEREKDLYWILFVRTFETIVVAFTVYTTTFTNEQKAVDVHAV